jgi:hypothetical protein
VWLFNPRPDLRTRFVNFRTRESALRLSENEEGLEAERELERAEDRHDGAEQADEEGDDDREKATDETEHERDQSREAHAVIPSETIGAVKSNKRTYSRMTTMA